jgi:hypothetical protein
MGTCCGNSAPQPPNPIQTAAAQTGTNVSTAIANSYLGNINQKTPQGSLTNEPTSTFTYTDPTSGQTFSIPRWTQTQTLTPTGQATFEQGQQSQYNLAQMANQQAQSVKGILGTPFNAAEGNFDAGNYLRQNPDVYNFAVAQGLNPYEFAGHHYNEFGQYEGRTPGGTPVAPMGDINLFNSVSLPQTQIGPTAGYQFGYGSGGDITRDFDPNSAGQIRRSYGPADNFSADRQRVEDALMARMNPQLQLEQQRMQEQLANQGVNAGGLAYQGAYDVYNRQANDARFAAIGQAGQEQQRMNEMARNQAMFENAAQQQGFTQAQARAMFQNQAQQQAEQEAAARAAFYNAASQSQFGEAATRGQFYNAAQQQMLGRQNAIFNAQNLLRGQGLQEAYQQRAQPLNEIAALMSGSQVQQPNFRNVQGNQIPTTDVAGLINQNFAQQNDLYKTGMQFWGDIAGGALGAAGSLGSAAYLRSDRNVKEDIDRMGTVLSDKGDALPIYQYSYRDDPASTRHIGPMAQDVEKINPGAVRKIGGVKHIDVERMGSIFGRGNHV